MSLATLIGVPAQQLARKHSALTEAIGNSGSLANLELGEVQAVAVRQANSVNLPITVAEVDIDICADFQSSEDPADSADSADQADQADQAIQVDQASCSDNGLSLQSSERDSAVELALSDELYADFRSRKSASVVDTEELLSRYGSFPSSVTTQPQGILKRFINRTMRFIEGALRSPWRLFKRRKR